MCIHVIQDRCRRAAVSRVGGELDTSTCYQYHHDSYNHNCVKSSVFIIIIEIIIIITSIIVTSAIALPAALVAAFVPLPGGPGTSCSRFRSKYKSRMFR